MKSYFAPFIGIGLGIGLAQNRRDDGFELYSEPFRPLNDEERLALTRRGSNLSAVTGFDSERVIRESRISYSSSHGGFTICLIHLRGRIYCGASRCSKSDRWNTIRGKHLAFNRAVMSEGIGIESQPESGDS